MVRIAAEKQNICPQLPAYEKKTPDQKHSLKTPTLKTKSVVLEAALQDDDGEM
jgi:hypothetical protein